MSKNDAIEYKSMYYNASVVMRNVPEIMGLDLKQKNNKDGYQWQGPYRLTGERCGHRKDKLKVFAWKGCVWVQEEGEPLMSLQRWLVEHGGCPDYRQAGRVLRLADPAKRVQECVIVRAAQRQAGKYVEAGVLSSYELYPIDSCPMYAWMCRMFGADKASEAFTRYKVTTNERGDAVYWYVDVLGNICHDKVMAYKWDGHRDKTRGGWRRHTTADGYTNRCYYGSHLIADGSKVMVVEGEKTAIMCSIVWPEYAWIATGGKNQLSDVEDGWTLLPDVDAADEWSGRGSVSRWWESFEASGEHSDIGDMIEFYAKQGRLDELRAAEMKERLLNNTK